MAVLTSLSSKRANLGFALLHFLSAAVVGTMLPDDLPQNIEKPAVMFVNPNGKTGSFRINIKYLIIAFTLITGMFHLLYALRGMAGKLRYIEYAVTASIMIMIIQLLSGEDNFQVLVLVLGLIASTMLFGFLQDDKIMYPGLSTAAFWFGWVPYIAAWFVVIMRFLNSVNSANGDEVPGFVKSIIWIEFLIFSCFAFVQWWFVVRSARPVGGPRYDGAYNLLSITAKMLLVWFAFFGLRGIGDTSAPTT